MNVIYTHLPRIIQLSIDADGPFAEVQLELTDGPFTIRWGLDQFTFISLKRYLSELGTEPQNQTGSLSTDVRLNFDSRWDPIESRYMGQLVTGSDALMMEATFPCSKLFVSNLHWLKTVKYAQEVERLRFQPAMRVRRFAMSESVQGSDAAPPVKRRHLRIVIPIVGVLVIIVCAVVGYALFAAKPRLTAIHGKAVPTLAGEKSGGTSTSTVNGTGTSSQQNDTSSASISESVTSLPSTKGALVPIIYQVPKGDVALTFDDGPSPYTEEIIQILNHYHIHATFFFVGDRVKLWPQSVRDAIRFGDVVGEHSLSHPLMTSLSPSAQADQITQAAADITADTQTPVRLFRPPYGAYDTWMEQVLRRNHMTLVLWNRDPKDWAATSAAQIVRTVLGDHPSGGLYTLNEKPFTVQALPAIIQGLEAQGLKFVTINAAEDGANNPV